MLKALRAFGEIATLLIGLFKKLVVANERKKVDEAVESGDTSELDDNNPSGLPGVQRIPKSEKDSF